jgi:hypothetical protein
MKYCPQRYKKKSVLQRAQTIFFQFQTKLKGFQTRLKGYVGKDFSVDRYAFGVYLELHKALKGLVDEK